MNNDLIYNSNILEICQTQLMLMILLLIIEYLEEQLLQKELQKDIITVEAGDGAVKVEITGEQKIKKIHINPDFVDLEHLKAHYTVDTGLIPSFSFPQFLFWGRAQIRPTTRP